MQADENVKAFSFIIQPLFSCFNRWGKKQVDFMWKILYFCIFQADVGGTETHKFLYFMFRVSYLLREKKKKKKKLSKPFSCSSKSNSDRLYLPKQAPGKKLVTPDVWLFLKFIVIQIYGILLCRGNPFHFGSQEG